MYRSLAVATVLVVLTTTSAAHAAKNPCTGVDRSLSDAEKARLAPVIARQVNRRSVGILQSFRYSGWTIIYQDYGDTADPAFLFYSRDPASQHYIAAWGGGATIFEGPSTRRWVMAHAPGIPRKLASCFAWHVTRD